MKNCVSKIVIVLLPILLIACSINEEMTSDPNYSVVWPKSTKPLPIEDGTIYKNGYEITLFEDRKANRVGDLITVILIENTNASKSASTSTTKDSEFEVGAPILLGRGLTKDGINLGSADLEASRSFTGEGDSSQSNSLNGTITVTVSNVLPNGNLSIQGEKLLTLNQGVEHIRLSGIVRPEDITPDNTINSSKIANARIIYGGQGTLADSNEKGWMQKIFDSPWWPF